MSVETARPDGAAQILGPHLPKKKTIFLVLDIQRRNAKYFSRGWITNALQTATCTTYMYSAIAQICDIKVDIKGVVEPERLVITVLPIVPSLTVKELL